MLLLLRSRPYLSKLPDPGQSSHSRYVLWRRRADTSSFSTLMHLYYRKRLGLATLETLGSHAGGII